MGRGTCKFFLSIGGVKMVIDYEINKVSTIEELIDEIDHKLPQPVGVMLFGADSELKKQVLRELQSGLWRAEVSYSVLDVHGVSKLVSFCKVSIFVLSSMESADHEIRHKCVTSLCDLGARTIVGIHAKAKLFFPKYKDMAPAEVAENELRIITKTFFPLGKVSAVALIGAPLPP